MDVVIDTNTWLKVIVMVAHCIASSPQRAQDELANKAVTLIVVGQKDVILKPLCIEGRQGTGQLMSLGHTVVKLIGGRQGDVCTGGYSLTVGTCDTGSHTCGEYLDKHMRSRINLVHS